VKQRNSVSLFHTKYLSANQSLQIGQGGISFSQYGINVNDCILVFNYS